MTDRKQEAPIKLLEPGCTQQFSLLRWMFQNKARLLFDALELFNLTVLYPDVNL